MTKPNLTFFLEPLYIFLQKLKSPLTIVADGCFSKLRKGLVKEVPEVKSHFIGILMKSCPQIKPHHAELILADPNPST